MNCRPGDMAIIVKSWAGNEGKIVTCVEYLGVVRWIEPGKGWVSEHTWLTDRMLNGIAGYDRKTICDSQLMPIRPGDLHETEDDLNEVSA